MKKILSVFLAAAMALSLAACGSNSDSDSESAAAGGASDKTITVTCLDGAGESVEVEVPYDPQRVVVVDMASLDILDNLGIGDRVVGTPTTALDYLQDYVNNDDIVNLGTIKTVDMELVMACEPDVIFMGGRMSEYYDDLCEIAPVVRLISDTDVGLVESVRNNATTISSIFGLEDKVDSLMSEFDARIEVINEFANGQDTLIGMCTSGGFNVLGNDGRCSLIVNECGFNNIGVDAAASSDDDNSSRSGHGNSDGGSDENGSSGLTPINIYAAAASNTMTVMIINIHLLE